MPAPELIDNFTVTRVGLPDGRWVIAKPYAPKGLYGLQVRIQHAWLVLTGQATAVVFDEDL